MPARKEPAISAKKQKNNILQTYL